MWELATGPGDLGGGGDAHWGCFSGVAGKLGEGEEVKPAPIDTCWRNSALEWEGEELEGQGRALRSCTPLWFTISLELSPVPWSPSLCCQPSGQHSQLASL